MEEDLSDATKSWICYSKFIIKSDILTNILLTNFGEIKDRCYTYTAILDYEVTSLLKFLLLFILIKEQCFEYFESMVIGSKNQLIQYAVCGRSSS